MCVERGVVLLLGDDIKFVEGRHYVAATATVVNASNPEEQVSVTAFAREEDKKTGMDSSQLTGSTSSYARKYALNGLFDIDDTKDADAAPQKKKRQTKPTNADDSAKQEAQSEEALALIKKITTTSKGLMSKGVELNTIYAVVEEICGTKKYNNVTDIDKLTKVLEAVSNLKGA